MSEMDTNALKIQSGDPASAFPELPKSSHSLSVGSPTGTAVPMVALVLNRGAPEEIKVTMCTEDAVWLGVALIKESERSSAPGGQALMERAAEAGKPNGDLDA